MADIDHFKAINDTYGHPIGDSVLQEFSSILKQSVREVDHTGRWGGEEFVIVLPKTIQSDGERIAITLQKKIEANSFTKVGQVTASFGVTQTQKGDTIESLFKRLDEALYRAKQSGRNQVVSLENDDASA